MRCDLSRKESEAIVASNNLFKKTEDYYWKLGDVMKSNLDEAVGFILDDEANDLIMQMELSISCENLNLSSSTYLSMLYIHEKRYFRYNLNSWRNDQWNFIGQTEQIHDEINPKFVTPVHVRYNFELRQKVF